MVCGDHEGRRTAGGTRNQLRRFRSGHAGGGGNGRRGRRGQKRRGGRQKNEECGSYVRAALDIHVAAVVAHDLIADGEAAAVAVVFGGETTVEEVRHVLLRDAGTPVAHGNVNV